MDAKLCPCGSRKPYSACCQPYIQLLKLNYAPSKLDSILFEWCDKYSLPIVSSFRAKTDKYVFRISVYLDAVLDTFLDLDLPITTVTVKESDIREITLGIKYNVLHSILASLTCLSQGLFIQSGILARTIIEDCLVLADLTEYPEQLAKLLAGKYSTDGLTRRIKRILPPNIVEWYGFFSNNFTHFGPLHSAWYLPTGCFGDNFVVAMGIQNIVRSVVCFHIVLERIHYRQTKYHAFWKFTKNADMQFVESSRVFDWAEKLGVELIAEYPPQEQTKDSTYSRIVKFR